MSEELTDAELVYLYGLVIRFGYDLGKDIQLGEKLKKMIKDG